MRTRIKLALLLLLSAQLAFASYSASTSNSGVSTTPSVTVPSNAANDIVILSINTDTTGTTLNFPAGFTALCTPAAGFDQHNASAWKRISAPDAGTYTFGSLGSSTDWAVVATVLSGRDTTNPPECGTATSNTTSNNSPVSITAPTLTALTGDDIVYVGGADVDALGIANVWTAPGSYTSRQSPESSGGWAAMNISTRDNVTAGATGAVTATLTLTSASSRWQAYLIRIPEAALAAAGHVGLVGKVGLTGKVGLK